MLETGGRSRETDARKDVVGGVCVGQSSHGSLFSRSVIGN